MPSNATPRGRPSSSKERVPAPVSMITEAQGGGRPKKILNSYCTYTLHLHWQWVPEDIRNPFTCFISPLRSWGQGGGPLPVRHLAPGAADGAVRSAHTRRVVEVRGDGPPAEGGGGRGREDESNFKLLRGGKNTASHQMLLFCGGGVQSERLEGMRSFAVGPEATGRPLARVTKNPHPRSSPPSIRSSWTSSRATPTTKLYICSA